MGEQAKDDCARRIYINSVMYYALWSHNYLLLSILADFSKVSPAKVAFEFSHSL